MIRPVLLLMVLGTWVALDVVLDERQMRTKVGAESVCTLGTAT